jgi:hypothetical protein
MAAAAYNERSVQARSHEGEGPASRNQKANQETPSNKKNGST